MLDQLNVDSIEIVRAIVEPALIESQAKRFQFERLGYFYKDPDSTKAEPVFNRIVTLRDGRKKA